MYVLSIADGVFRAVERGYGRAAARPPANPGAPSPNPARPLAESGEAGGGPASRGTREMAAGEQSPQLKTPPPPPPPCSSLALSLVLLLLGPPPHTHYYIV